jgi:hypothetical protein
MAIQQTLITQNYGGRYMDEKVITTTVIFGQSLTFATVLAANIALMPVPVFEKMLSTVYISEKLLKRNVMFIVFFYGRKRRRVALSGIMVARMPSKQKVCDLSPEKGYRFLRFVVFYFAA